MNVIGFKFSIDIYEIYVKESVQTFWGRQNSDATLTLDLNQVFPIYWGALEAVPWETFQWKIWKFNLEPNWNR